MEYVGLETEVKPIKTPVFHVGDKVLCIDETSKYYQQVVTIVDVDMDMPFSPYQIDENHLINDFTIDIVRKVTEKGIKCYNRGMANVCGIYTGRRK